MARTSRQCRRLPAGITGGLLIYVVATMIPPQAAAHTGASAVKECRATVGRPIVSGCVRSRVLHQGGAPRTHVRACRIDAIPAVRACVQRTVPHLVENCRQAVGRPMVQACVRSRVQGEGGPPDRFVEQCRLSISWAVRACVWRSAAVTPLPTGP